MGGGDLKLFAAIGAALGPTPGLEVQIVAYVAAALYAGGGLIRRGTLTPVLVSAARLVVRAHRSPTAFIADGNPSQAVSLGVFIFLGCVLSAAHCAWGAP